MGLYCNLRGRTVGGGRHRSAARALILKFEKYFNVGGFAPLPSILMCVYIQLRSSRSRVRPDPEACSLADDMRRCLDVWVRHAHGCLKMFLVFCFESFSHRRVALPRLTPPTHCAPIRHLPTRRCCWCMKFSAWRWKRCSGRTDRHPGGGGRGFGAGRGSGRRVVVIFVDAVWCRRVACAPLRMAHPRSPSLACRCCRSRQSGSRATRTVKFSIFSNYKLYVSISISDPATFNFRTLPPGGPLRCTADEPRASAASGGSCDGAGQQP